MATISEAKYFGLVKETLTEKWSQYRQPLCINDDDLTAGMALFAKIAAEVVDTSDFAKESESPSLSASHEVSLETASWSGTVNKIKAFIEYNACAFRRVCQTGFPFSLLESHPTEHALKRALDYDSILSHFMMLEDSWMSESELDERFGGPFQRLQASEIAKACSDLKRAYVRDKDNKAGYYLLWLIKQATECVYEIPEKSSFNDVTIAKVLSEFFAGPGSLRNAANFVEILHSRSSRLDRSLYQEFLDQKSRSICLNFAVRQLVEIPMNKWPSKVVIITDLLETEALENKLAITRALASSKDPATSEVGNHLLAALTACSLREAIPHFNALTELLPHFNYTHIMIIFGRPFIEFCHDRSCFKEDPEFTKRLRFNNRREVFVHGSLMMGVYNNTSITCEGKRIPPHLLAYDMNTEKMVWGIPLTPISLKAPLNASAAPMTFDPLRMSSAGYFLKRVGELLSLHFAGEKKLHFIHPETGEFDSTLELPEASINERDCLHVSPKGFAYQMLYKSQGRILIGGRIIDKRWNPSFEVATPDGMFCPFSTHCGFQQNSKASLVLFGPTGDQATIEGCIAAKAQDDKLYSIEKDPVNKDKCLLKVRMLKDDSEVISGIEKSISLNVRQASFGKICQNGWVILFVDSFFDDISSIFVNLNSQEITYSSHKFSSDAEHVINADSGELWTWDQISHKIWKVSSANITLMGSMKSGRGTTLLHVDKADRLYFVDIPF
jgi:hypothetical protein